MFPEGSELLRPEQGVEEIRQQDGGHEKQHQGSQGHRWSLEFGGDAGVGVHDHEADEDEHDRSDITHGSLGVRSDQVCDGVNAEVAP